MIPLIREMMDERDLEVNGSKLIVSCIVDIE